jgi:hypothetical protein
MADTRPRIARFTTPAALRAAAAASAPPATTIERLAGPAGRGRPSLPMPPVAEDDVVDVEYIVEEKPKASVVRDFFRVQARSLSECNAGEASYL